MNVLASANFDFRASEGVLRGQYGVSGMYDFVEGNWCAKLGLLTFVLA